MMTMINSRQVFAIACLDTHLPASTCKCVLKTGKCMSIHVYGHVAKNDFTMKKQVYRAGKKSDILEKPN